MPLPLALFYTRPKSSWLSGAISNVQIRQALLDLNCCWEPVWEPDLSFQSDLVINDVCDTDPGPQPVVCISRVAAGACRATRTSHCRLLFSRFCKMLNTSLNS